MENENDSINRQIDAAAASQGTVAASGGPARPAGFKKAFQTALPIMLAYLAIGLPCGLLEMKAGLTPVMVVLLSIIYYTGAGQFMIPGMIMAQTPLAAMIASLSFVNTRQILYSAALAPYCEKVSKRLALLFSANVTDESFGINLDQLVKDPAWTVRDGWYVNLLSQASWTAANLVGALAGAAIDLPTAMLSFTMTAIFICLLVTQPINRTTLIVMAVTALGVAACKLAGLTGPAILIGALVGVAAGLLWERVGEK